MNINKVIVNDTTLIDLTEDTITSDKLLKGITAHTASGESIIGNLILESEWERPSDWPDITSLDLSEYEDCALFTLDKNNTPISELRFNVSGTTTVTTGSPQLIFEQGTIENGNFILEDTWTSDIDTSNIHIITSNYDYPVIKMTVTSGFKLSSFNFEEINLVSFNDNPVVECRIKGINITSFGAGIGTIYLQHIQFEDIQNITTFKNILTDSYELKQIDWINCSTANVTSFEAAFQNCYSLASADWIKNFNTSNCITFSEMFENCASLTELDCSYFNTDKVTSINNMFSECSSLKNINVSNWNTTNVTNIDNIFENCNNIIKLDLSSWDVSNAVSLTTLNNTIKNLQEYKIPNNIQYKAYNFLNAKLNFNSIQYMINNIGNGSYHDLLAYSNVYTEDDLKILEEKEWIIGSIPSNYSLCNYLESTGTQYIDLGLSLDVSTNRFILDVMPTKLTSTSATGSDYNGVMGANSSPQIGWTKTQWTVGNAGSSSSIILAPVEYTRYTIEYSKNFTGDFWVNDINTNLKRTGNMVCKIFYVANKPDNCYVRVYSAKSYDNTGKINFYLRPCLDADGIPCMYDSASKQTFYNAGLGDFLYELA